MRISVAMTARNATRYLETLLASLARQTRRPHELVAHDDASDDGTLSMLEEFAGRAPFPVRIDADPVHRGLEAGFFRAAELCDGDAIAFCDADDVWLDHKLEVCGERLEAAGAALVLHSTRVVDDDHERVAPDWPAISAARLVPPLGHTGLDLDAPGMAMVFRREVLEIADPSERPHSRYDPGQRMLHDEYALFIAGVLGPVQLVADPLVLYRQHGSNYSGWFERRRRTTFEPAVDDYRASADHTAACAAFLDRVQTEDRRVAARLAAGAEHYRRTAASWDARRALYSVADRRRRARMVRQLVAAGAYRPRTSGGFGRVALGKDLVGGVALRASAQDGA